MSVASSSTFLKKKSKVWRTLVAVILVVMGAGSVIWGTHHLLQMSEVPSCTIPVDEIKEVRAAEDHESEEDGEDLVLSSGGFGQIRVEITGAVKKPGLYWLSFESRVVDLVKLAGGLGEDADLQRVNQELNLAQKLQDEQRVIIPQKQELEIEQWLKEYCENKTTGSTASQAQVNVSEQASSENITQDEKKPVAETAPAAQSTDKCISINHASTAALQTLTGVGDKTAQLIIEGRPYSKISELLEVKGIGDATLEKLEAFICL